MAKDENIHVIIDYFDDAYRADEAADALKEWDWHRDDIKLGGIAILTWQDGEMHARKVGRSRTGRGAAWGTALGPVVGILSGGMTLVAGALYGAVAGAVTGSLFHEGLGMTDADKTQLEERLKNGGAALVVMASDDEIEATKAYLSSFEYGEVQDYQVPKESAKQLENATDVPPPDDSD